MAVEIHVPVLGESVVEATVSRWLKKVGDLVTAGEAVVELETDKVNAEVAAESSGVLSAITRNEGDIVSPGDVLGSIGGGDGAGATSAAPVAETAPVEAHPAPNAAGAAPSAPTNGVAPAATPVAAKMAADNNIDLAQVKPSRADGKIGKDDVANQIERAADAPVTANVKAQETAQALPPARPVAPAVTPPATVGATSSANGRPEERIQMTRRRKTIAARLVEAQRTAAMLTTFNEVDMTAIMEIRKRRKDTFKERFGVGLGFMSFFTKASIGALKAFPYLNAEIQGDEIVVKKYYDIGIAVGAEGGLVVPVVRDADQKSFAQIEKNIGELAGKARDNSLALSDLVGGTFTITNGGVFGSLMSTPILNAPQVGILGMHKIQERVMVEAGQMVIKPMMYLALSYDHRIVDGSEAVRFLVRIKELLEDPESLLLEG